MSRLRLGVDTECAAAPLAWGFDRSPWQERYSIERATPNELVVRLGRRELDVALLPPQLVALSADTNEIVPGMSIVTDGTSCQARLDARVPLRDVRRIAVCPTGHAAELLVRVLFAASGASVSLTDAEDPRADAVLRTGDAAVLDPVPDGAEATDLGAAWSSLTGLPMVWSVWVARAGFVERDTYAVLHTARTRGRHDLRRVALEHCGARAADAERLATAIEDHVAYRLGNRQLAGFRQFLADAARLGLAPPVPTLRFLPLGAGSACHRVARNQR